MVELTVHAYKSQISINLCEKLRTQRGVLPGQLYAVKKTRLFHILLPAANQPVKNGDL